MELATTPQNSPVVLLLHGMFGKADNWQSCAEHLQKDFRVLVPELPLFNMPAQATGIEGLSNHILKFLDQHAVEDVVIGGNSLGGHIALQMALRFPDRVKALILAGSSGLFERGFERSVPRRPTREWLRVKVREVFYDESHVTEALLDEVSDTILDPRRALKILRVAKSAKHDNLRNVLHRINCPVLLAWGSDDNITPPSVAQEFKEFLPNAELSFIARCGHAPMMERPEQFNEIVAQFLKRIFGPLSLEPAATRA